MLSPFMVQSLRVYLLMKDGMKPDELEETIITLKELGRKIKFIYVIPDFQNPSGITIPDSRRLKIIEIADKYDLLIVEDCPYREVRFEGEPQKLMNQLDTAGRVITLCTFSKIFAPGFRVGWVVGNPKYSINLLWQNRLQIFVLLLLFRKSSPGIWRKGYLIKI